MAQTKIYRSKVNIPLALVVFVPIIAGLILTLSERTWGAAAIMGLTLVFLSAMYLTTFYAITAEQDLVVRGGPFISRRIPIANINRLQKTRTILAGPALSMDRLYVQFDQGDAVVISPVRKSEFIDALLKINPNIEINA
ncbi:PH domain-containing protein [Cryomorphaceae bacterium]|nr:PH domain-containing protein [Cryomorphaceae bacterium]